MNILLKLVAMGLSVGAVTLGPRIADVAWRVVSKDDPPTDLEDTERSMGAVIGFAVLSATTIAVLQVLSKRGAYKVAQKIAGDPRTDAEV